MSPEAIPWILCSSICIIPALVGTSAYFAWTLFTNRSPSRDVSTWQDDQGRKHITTEWIMLSREEKKFRNQTEVKE